VARLQTDACVERPCSSNTGVLAFYRSLGYLQDDVVSMGKRLVEDPPSTP